MGKERLAANVSEVVNGRWRPEPRVQHPAHTVRITQGPHYLQLQGSHSLGAAARDQEEAVNAMVTFHAWFPGGGTCDDRQRVPQCSPGQGKADRPRGRSSGRG